MCGPPSRNGANGRCPTERLASRRSTTFCPQGLSTASRMSSELGWEPRHSFDEGLEATVRWYLDHQDWCNQVRQLSGYPAYTNTTPSSLVAQRATLWFDAFGG